MSFLLACSDSVIFRDELPTQRLHSVVPKAVRCNRLFAPYVPIYCVPACFLYQLVVRSIAMSTGVGSKPNAR